MKSATKFLYVKTSSGKLYATIPPLVHIYTVSKKSPPLNSL